MRFSELEVVHVRKYLALVVMLTALLGSGDRGCEESASGK